MTYAEKQELEMLISTEKQMNRLAIHTEYNTAQAPDLRLALDLAFLAGAQSALASVSEEMHEQAVRAATGG